jgi:hypothetical protein
MYTIAFNFELIFTNNEYYEMGDLLLRWLTATSICFVAHLLGITEKFLYISKYKTSNQRGTEDVRKMKCHYLQPTRRTDT